MVNLRMNLSRNNNIVGWEPDFTKHEIWGLDVVKRINAGRKVSVWIVTGLISAEVLFHINPFLD